MAASSWQVSFFFKVTYMFSDMLTQEHYVLRALMHFLNVRHLFSLFLKDHAWRHDS